MLSNSSRAGDPNIRLAISRLDRAIMKLDAGNERMFFPFNRPVRGLEYREVVAGLAEMRGITLQALFAAGSQGNLQQGHIEDWIEIVKMIRPDGVQIYSLSRAVPCKDITPASQASLIEIHNRLSREGIAAEVF